MSKKEIICSEEEVRWLENVLVFSKDNKQRAKQKPHENDANGKGRNKRRKVEKENKRSGVESGCHLTFSGSCLCYGQVYSSMACMYVLFPVIFSTTAY